MQSPHSADGETEEYLHLFCWSVTVLCSYEKGKGLEELPYSRAGGGGVCGQDAWVLTHPGRGSPSLRRVWLLGHWVNCNFTGGHLPLQGASRGQGARSKRRNTFLPVCFLHLWNPAWAASLVGQKESFPLFLPGAQRNWEG